jgi:hypothetical protein
MVKQVGYFSGDRLFIVIFASHHHLHCLFAYFFENFIVAARQQFAGVGIGLGTIATIANGIKQFR